MKTKELRKHLTLRPDVTSDHYGVGIICNEYKTLPIKDRVVLDLGGNIGAFAAYAALMGCKQVITYEPEEENFKVLEANVAAFPDRVVAHRAAVLSSAFGDVKTVDFWKTKGKAADGYSVVEFNGRDRVTVPAVQLDDILAEYRPSSIKMDVEGCEFDLLMNTVLPDFVTDFIMEIHFSKRRFREGYEALVAKFDGWEVIKQPKETGKNFNSTGQWRRV